jgi:hypothetical protein
MLSAIRSEMILVNELEIRFVQQRRRIQRGIAMPCAALSSRDCSQLFIHHWKAGFESSTVTVFCSQQKLGHPSRDCAVARWAFPV